MATAGCIPWGSARGWTAFDALRLMDEQKVERIFAEAVDAHGLGLAIMNRMGRAAAFHVLDADRGE